MDFLHQAYVAPVATIFMYTTRDIITLSVATDFSEDDMIIEWNN